MDNSLIYKRQEKLELKEVGPIIVVGCGGIGYNFTKIAAMSGIKSFYLYDDDTIEAHNLNRIDVPIEAIGMNKADVTMKVVTRLRNVSILAFPFKLSKTNYPPDNNIEWLVDCTDKFASQKDNYEIAQDHVINYMKIGYDGESFSIHNHPALWGNDDSNDDGYRIVPSWSVPAILVSCLAVAKIMKYQDETISSDIKTLMYKF
jgi:molybdopterin/thiamine biosynthesis adenylyltransferase